MGGALEKLVRRMRPGKPGQQYLSLVDRVNSLEPETAGLDDAALLTSSLRLCERRKKGESLEPLPPEAFALAREASKRALGLRPRDVQLIAAAALFDGCIAEMKTGEGKTLAAAVAAYAGALDGRGVHIVTANEYLARRDCEQMNALYAMLGMRAALVERGMSVEQRKDAYAAPITYSTGSELGFDYLRDNMTSVLSCRVQRGHAFAIVDEADAVLIDGARSPLIISGPSERPRESYAIFARIVARLDECEDVEVDEASKLVCCTEKGLAAVERMLGVDDLFSTDVAYLNLLHQALRARFLFHRDVDYVVDAGEVKIVDALTGRIMAGRRWPDGLHQAIEAKERVFIKEKSLTLASITVQNYFRMYGKLSGMTGTAYDAQREFAQVYAAPVIGVPTHAPMRRIDAPDELFRTSRERDQAVVDETLRRHGAGQPVLVGTTSVEQSERISRLMLDAGIEHEVLNAKNDADEAAIVARAGALGAVTVSTGIAGRGTDIVVGSDACKLGGLAILGVGHSESARADDQLRGRAGRQGAPGFTRFFASLEDDLVKKFGQPPSWSSRCALSPMTFAEAQRIAQAMYSDERMRELEYDNVIDAQRRRVYAVRRDLLDKSDACVHGAQTAVERKTLLAAIDSRWAGYLSLLDDLKSGIALRSYGNRDPLTEYREEAAEAFADFESAVYDEYRKRLKVTAGSNGIQRFDRSASGNTDARG